MITVFVPKNLIATPEAPLYSMAMYFFTQGIMPVYNADDELVVMFRQIYTANFAPLIALGIKIIDSNFLVKVSPLILDNEVPADFPNRELNGAVRTWRNYAILVYDDPTVSTDESYIMLGHYPDGECRPSVGCPSDELYKWVSFFGVGNILTETDDISAAINLYPLIPDGGIIPIGG